MFKTIVDSSDNIIYLVDPKTYTLRFLNQKGKEVYGIGEEVLGQPCYKMLHGYDGPCPFCNNHLLQEDVPFVWEHTNELLGRHYLLKDKLIRWENGELLRMEIATDITQQEKRQLALDEKYRAQKSLVQCLRLLGDEPDIDQAIAKTLQVVGEFYQADRAYIFELDYQAGTTTNTYEWCAAGVQPEKDSLQQVPIEGVSFWIQEFQRGNAVDIQDVESIKERNLFEYETLKRQNVRSLKAVALREADGRVTGFLGVDNPAHSTRDVALISDFGYFIRSDIQKRKMERKLAHMSLTDQLTGTGNRNKYAARLGGLRANPPASLGVIFADVNDLKQINDSQGHDGGDRAIQAVADVLRQAVGEEVYRIGGDEFVAFFPDASQETLQRVFQQVQSRMAGAAALGWSWSTGDVVPGDLVQLADSRMYRSKRGENDAP